jgi:cytochrome c-type biogenesis protein CcmE
MNLKVIVAIVLLAVAAGVGVSSFKRTMTPYIGFAEARTASGMVQVNGKLADKDYVLKPEEQFLRFKLRDEKGDVMPVEYRGVIPGNFDQAVSVVAIGNFQGDHFEASQLLVKCPSKYQAEADKAAQKGMPS